HARPGRLVLLLPPDVECLESPIEQPVGLSLLGGDEADCVLVQALWRKLRFDIGDEAELVVAAERLDRFDRLLACRHGDPRGSHYMRADLMHPRALTTEPAQAPGHAAPHDIAALATWRPLAP